MKKREQNFSYLLLMVLLFLLNSCAPEEPDVTKRVDVKVSARRLCIEYDKNPGMSDTKYKGKVILITGKIHQVKTDVMDWVGIIFKTKDGAVVQCLFSRRHIKKLKKLRKGKSVNVKGRCDGKFHNVKIKGCVLIKKNAGY